MPNMSALWTAKEVAKAVGGKADNDWCAWRVEIDSRKVQAGDLFVALKGENFDGHDFLEKAFATGAIAAIVERKMPCAGNQIIVPNALKALEDLGKYNRSRTNAKIIGITGSVGKTSTKEMLRLALAKQGKTYATTGNYNNHIGTPISLANMPIDTDYGVFEMGMSHESEISHLTKMVRPDIALITRVEAAHLEFFSGIEEIAKAKAEIFEGLQENGIAIINADQPYFRDAVQRKILFGENKMADCRLISYRSVASGCAVTAEIMGERVDYQMSATGRHWAVVSLSVLAVCHALGLDEHKSANAIKHFREVEGRGRVSKIMVAGGEAFIIDDSYNASPASMRSAFAKTIEAWAARSRKGRKIAALGDMFELGNDAAKMHKELAQSLQAAGFDTVHSAGKLMKNMQDSLPEEMRGTHTQTAMELLEQIKLKPHDVLLIKGSHSSKMHELAKKLLQR